EHTNLNNWLSSSVLPIKCRTYYLNSGFTDDPYIAEQVSSFNENFETSQYKLECFYRTIGFRPIVPDPEDSNSAHFMARPSSVDYYKVLSDDTENKNL
uniref:hypothetical protein n=1 Tax=Vibrio anguillarum TaxID=55601 RepID=UPI001D18C8DE